MQNLLRRITSFRKELLNKQLFIFLDYDGTIAPIADNPENAVIPQKTRELLNTLAVMENAELAVVSGRELKDVKKMTGIKGIVYAGNHGLEIEGPGIEYCVKIPQSTQAILKNIKKMLSFKLDTIKGAYIEDKGLAVSLHYRNAEKGMLSVLQGYFNYIVQPYVMAGNVEVLAGKMVYEVRPHADWNKGNAVMWIISRARKDTGKDFLPVYIGDDVTDESVFKCLESTGITVRVGEHSQTYAKYFLKDTAEVYEILKEISRVLTA